MSPYNRRDFLGMLAVGFAGCSGVPPEGEADTSSDPPLAATVRGPLIETHLHLFAADSERFPFHPNAPYQPEPFDLEAYKHFVEETGLDHAVIVHPEPYQDDHRYLEHCFQNEPRPGFFKGTCLFDAYRADTPDRMAELVQRHPDRIVALRIHATNPPDEPPIESGAIKNRDLTDSRVADTWQAATDLGLAIQMHFLPHHAAEIGSLADQFAETTVILDHLGRAGMGTEEDFAGVIALAERPNVNMKLSGLPYSSEDGYPYLDAQPIVKQAFDAFGPDRMIWGGLGHTEEELARNLEMLDLLLDFTDEEARAKIRGGTAERLFNFG